jgi:cytochrome c oxidase cbb3-type subunit 3
MAVGFFVAALMVAGTANNARAESASDNYSLYCVQCHGKAGVGKGINAPALSVQPRNHTSAKDMGALKDDGVALAIRDGGIAVGKSAQMPSFKKILTEAEITDLVKHLRGMCKCQGPQ